MGPAARSTRTAQMRRADTVTVQGGVIEDLDFIHPRVRWATRRASHFCACKYARTEHADSRHRPMRDGDSVCGKRKEKKRKRKEKKRKEKKRKEKKRKRKRKRKEKEKEKEK